MARELTIGYDTVKPYIDPQKALEEGFLKAETYSFTADDPIVAGAGHVQSMFIGPEPSVQRSVMILKKLTVPVFSSGLFVRLYTSFQVAQDDADREPAMTVPADVANALLFERNIVTGQSIFPGAVLVLPDFTQGMLIASLVLDDAAAFPITPALTLEVIPLESVPVTIS